MFFQDCRTFLTQRLILQLLFPYEIAGVCAGRQRGVDCTDHRASKFGINFAQARETVPPVSEHGYRALVHASPHAVPASQMHALVIFRQPTFYSPSFSPFWKYCSTRSS